MAARLRRLSKLKKLKKYRYLRKLRKLKKLEVKTFEQGRRLRWLESAVKYLLRTRCQCELRALRSNIAARAALDCDDSEFTPT